MGETLEKIKNQLNEFWQQTDKNKKIKLGIAVFLIVFSTTAIIYMITKTKYEVLYSNLTLEDAGIITKKLDDMGIEWKTGKDESTILVPANLKNKIKYELASEGLPNPKYSFQDAFNDSSWTMTDYERKQRLKYALENQLANDISKISGIEEATVYIYMPEDTGFVLNSEEKAKASVYVTLSGSNILASEKVQAIKNFVAGATKELNPEDVTIIDGQGRSYGEEENDLYNQYNLTDQFNIQYTLQNKVENSIKKFLENIFGYGNVAVRASVKMNFDSEVANIKEFTPPIDGSSEGLIRSMETVEEHMVNGSNGGVPGVESNTNDIPDYAQEDQGSSKYDNARKVINYELNEINKQIRKATGQVESITVAIIVNEDVLNDSELTQDEKKEIADLIYAATGLDTKQVQVHTAKFNKDYMQDELFNNDTEELNKNMPLWIVSVLLAALVATIGTVVYMGRRRKDNMESAIEQAISNNEEIQEIDIEGKGESEMIKQINKFVDRKPEEVAQLLRNWLNEE